MGHIDGNICTGIALKNFLWTSMFLVVDSNEYFVCIFKMWSHGKSHGNLLYLIRYCLICLDFLLWKSRALKNLKVFICKGL